MPHKRVKEFINLKPDKHVPEENPGDREKKTL